MHFLKLNDNLLFSEGEAFMIDEIKKIFYFQKSTNIKCLHNEIRIIKEILENGPIASLDLMKKTGRSISGHNQDLKRLLDIGALEIIPTCIDHNSLAHLRWPMVIMRQG
jgi:predicted transcriptional regulator